MNTATYQEKMAALGIERGALVDGFPCEDGTCTLANRQPSLVNRRSHMKVSAASIGLPIEDLTGLNPAISVKMAQAVSERARRRRELLGRATVAKEAKG